MVYVCPVLSPFVFRRTKARKRLLEKNKPGWHCSVQAGSRVTPPLTQLHELNPPQAHAAPLTKCFTLTREKKLGDK
jgi:hypothetical protein